MALNLVCVAGFAGYAKGFQISDAPTAAAFWSTRPWNFVQVQDTSSAPTWQNQAGAPTNFPIEFNAINIDGNCLLVGSAHNGADYLYCSRDRGTTWPALTNFGARAWFSGKVSSNGLTIAATTTSANVYVSTDGGNTVSTVAVSGASQITQIAMSGDGTKILVLDNSNGRAFMSLNSGASFTKVFDAGQSSNGHVAISRDGTTQILNYNAGSSGVLLTTNNWSTNTNVSPGSSAVSQSTFCNGNGRVIFVGDNGGQVWRTVDQGATWLAITTPHQFAVGGVSDDGATAIFTDLSSSLTYITDDFGVTLVAQNPPGAIPNSGAAVSGDKSLGMIQSVSNGIYTFVAP